MKMFKNCCAVVYAINWEQDSGERTPGLEGKILKFEFELKVLNSNLSKLVSSCLINATWWTCQGSSWIFGLALCGDGAG